MRSESIKTNSEPRPRQRTLTVNIDTRRQPRSARPNHNPRSGACFYAHTGFQALALSRTRGADAAFARMAGALENFESTRFWSQRFSWLEGVPMGADIATENLFVVWGGLFASFGVRVELLGGVVVVGPAAAALEGANLTVGVGGKDVTINVQGGWARVLV